MADVNANIDINIDSSNAVANLRRLEVAINEYQRNIASANTAAANSSAALNRALVDGINNTGMFSAKIAPATDSIGRFTTALEKNKLSLGEYTKYAASQLPGLSRVFRREFDTMQQVAESRVKKMQTQYLALGQTVDGTARSISMMPRGLAPGYATDVAIATQRHQMFNKMIDDGSTKLLNWGKNTQWAGRQLMVGFSIPLAALGVTASKTFMEIDKATTSLKRVYGDLNTNSEEVNKNIAAINALGKEYTKYGIALSDTVNVAATAAAAGMKNEQLTANTKESLRLATLGQIDYQQALTTTITLQNAFGTSNKELAPTVDFIGAVANQTVLSVDDLTNAIPRVAPVIKGLGGNVKDLAVLLVAMREGGVSAEQGANALKSGLANLINPTKAASKAAAQYSIDLQGIVNANKGDIMGTIKSLATALSSLDEFSRQQVLEKIFGKYQFARIGALFDHINEKTGQVKQAMDLLGMSTEDLAKVSDKSLSAISESTTVKFQAALEQLKISIAPLGQAFLKGITPIVNMVSKVADAFNNLPDGVKNAAAVIIAAVAGIGPILLMTVGLLANGFANIIKVIQVFRKGLAGIRGDGDSFKYLSTAELEAAAATDALEGSVQSLTGKLLLQKGAVSSLTQEYLRFIDVAGIASAVDGLGGFGGVTGGVPTRGAAATRGASKAAMRMATGGIVPGTGNGDTIPALLTPGESVITKKATQKYAPILQQMNDGTLPGFATGGVGLISATRRLLNPKDLNWKYFVSDRSAPQTMKANAASITGGYTDELFKDILGLGLGRKPNDQEFKKLFERLYYSGKNGEKIKSGFGAAMSIAHIENLGRNRSGYKQWDYENTRLTSGLENSALNDLFKSTRSKNFFLSKIQDLSLTKEDQQILTRIIKNGRHPSSIKEYKLLENLLVSSRKSKDFQNLYRKNSNNYLYTDFLIGVSRARRAETSAAKTLIKKHGEDPYALFTGEPLTFGQTVEKKAKGYSLGKISIGEALKTWQTSAKQVRENPEALAAIMGGMQQSSTSRTLHRSTTLGLGRGSEFNPQESAILFEALRSGNVGSLVGREFSIDSPVSYTAGGLDGTLGALAQNTDVNRINSLINQLYQRKNRRADDLKLLQIARRNFDAGIMPDLNEKRIKELEQKTEKTKYLAEQKRLQQQIKELAPRGYQNVVFEQRFPKGSPLLDVNAATGGAGTYMGQNVAHEQEFISPGSRVKVVDVQVDPKTGLTKIITEALPSSFSANPKIPMSRQEQIAAIEKRSIAAAERYDGLKEQSLGSILKLKFNDRREASSPSEFLSGMFKRWESVPTRPSPKEDMQLTMKSGKLKYPAIPQDEYLADMIMNSAKFKDYAPDTFKPIKVGKIQNIGDTERIFDGHTRVHAKTVEGIIRNILGKNPENMSKQELIDAINEVKVMSEKGLLTNKQILSATKGQTLLTTQAGIDEIDRMTLRSRTQQPMQSMYNSGGRILIEGIHDREIEQILAAGRDAGFRGIGNDSLSLMKAMGFVRPTMGDNNWYRYDPNFLYRENGSYVTNTARKILNGLIDRKMILPLRRNSGGPIPGVGTQDTVPALLTPGEFVVNKDAAAQHSSLLHSINGNNIAQSYAGVQHFAGGGFVASMMKKAEDLSLYLNARHGSMQPRNWNPDPLSQTAIAEGVTKTQWGPGIYLAARPSKNFLDLILGGRSGREARLYSNFTRVDSAMGKDGAGYVYRQSRNPLAMMKLLRGKGYLPYSEIKNFGLTENMLQKYDANTYRKLRDMGYHGITIPQSDGQIFIVDFTAGTTRNNNMTLASARNPFGWREGRQDKWQLKEFRAYEKAQAKRAKEIEKKNKRLENLTPDDEGFFLNDGAVMLGHGMVPGVGNKDTIPAMLTPGESVITKEATRRYAPILSQMNRGTLQGFEGGVVASKPSQSKKVYSGKIPTLKMIEALPDGPTKDKYLREFSIAYKASLAAAKETGSLVQVDKAHLETPPPGPQKPFSTHLWTPQAGVENQFTSLMSEKQFDPTKMDNEDYVKNIEDQNKSAEKRRAVFEKSLLAVSGQNNKHTAETAKLMVDLKAGNALDHNQLVMQTKALEHQAANPQELAKSGLDEDKQKKYLARSAEVIAAGNSRIASVNMTNEEALALRNQYKENLKTQQKLLSSQSGPKTTVPQTNTSISTKQIQEKINAQAKENLRQRGMFAPTTEQFYELHGHENRSELISLKEEYDKTLKEERTRLSKEFGRENARKIAIERNKLMQERNLSHSEATKMARESVLSGREIPKQIIQTTPIVEEGMAENAKLGKLASLRGRLAPISGKFGALSGGLSMAMGMGSMLPMMAHDKEGKFLGMDAGTASMAMIGGSSLLGLLPMLGAAAGPILGLGVVAGGAALAISHLMQSEDEASKKAGELGANLGGASNSIAKMSSILGTASPLSKMSQLKLGISNKDLSEYAAKFQNVIGSDQYNSMIEELKAATSEERFSKLSDYLKNAIATGMMTAVDAQDFGKLISYQLKDAILGSKIGRELTGQETGSRAVLDIANKKSSILQGTQEYQTMKSGKEFTASGGAEASKIIGSSFQIINEAANSIAMAQQQYASGEITQQEYSKIIAEATTLQNNYNQAIDEALAKTNDFGSTMQSVQDQLVKSGIISQDQFNAIDAAAKAANAASIAPTLGLSPEEINHRVATRMGPYGQETRPLNTLTEDEMKNGGFMTVDSNGKVVSVSEVHKNAGATSEASKALQTLHGDILTAVMANPAKGADYSQFATDMIDNVNLQNLYGKYRAIKGITGNNAVDATMLANSINNGEMAGVGTTDTTLLTGNKKQKAEKRNTFEKNVANNALQSYLTQGGTAEQFNSLLLSAAPEKRISVIATFRESNKEQRDQWINDVDKLKGVFKEEGGSDLSMNITMSTKYKESNPEEKNRIILGAEAFNKLPAYANKTLIYNLETKDGQNPLDPDEARRRTEWWNKNFKDLGSSNKSISRKAEMNIATKYNKGPVSEKELNAIRNDVKNWDKLLPADKDANLNLEFNVRAKFDIGGEFGGLGIDNTKGLKNIRKQIEDKIKELTIMLDSIRALGAAAGPGAAQAAQTINSQLTSLNKALTVVDQGINNLGSGGSSGEGSGGGGGTKTDPLKEMNKSFIEQIRLYDNINANVNMLNGKRSKLAATLSKGKGIIEMLRKAGISELIIGNLAQQGSDALKKAYDKFTSNGKVNEKGRKENIAALVAGQGAMFAENTTKGTMTGMGNTALAKLKQAKASQAVIDEVLGDPQKLMVIALSSQKIVKNYVDEIIAQSKREEDALLNSNPLQAFSKYSEILNDALAKQEDQIRNDNAQKFLATNGMTVEAMQHQIDENNRLIQQEQDKINAKQRQIDDLSRQDELNNRISNALSHDLDIMSQQEQKIRETYQKRIDALNKVAEINDHIAQQQQTQIGLAKALSEGDIYAAAQAAQQMQQDQVQYARKQQQDSLQTGMQNAVDNLRTSSGLTRSQAEEQINGIKEQSYQIGLRIRDIQDEIYTIQNGQMRTLQDQNDQYSRTLQYNDQDLNWQLQTTTFQDHTRSWWADHLKYLGDALKDTTDLETATRNLLLLMAQNPIGSGNSSSAPSNSSGGNSSVQTPPQVGTAPWGDPIYQDSNGNQWTTLPGFGITVPIPRQNESSVIGYSNIPMATGGMVPRYYASGGHVNMDSVPAMLTPGEFVMRKAAVQKYGMNTLSNMNLGKWDIPTYNTGKLYAPSANVSAPSRGNMQNNISAPVYNTYSINVPVNQPGASADEIANKVMMKIKNIESSSIRRIGGY